MNILPNSLGKEKKKRGKEGATFRRSALIFSVLMVVWPIINWCITFVYANIDNIILTFQKWDATEKDFAFIGFDSLFNNYVEVFKDMFANKTTMTYILRGVIMSIPNTILVTPFLYLFPFIIFKRVPLSKTFRIVLYLPNILSSMVTMMYFKYFIDGALPDLMYKAFGIERFPMLIANTKYTLYTLMSYSVFMGWSGNVVLTVNMFNRVPPELYESGKIDGLNMWGEFKYIGIPMIYPLVAMGLYGWVISAITYEGPFYQLYGDSTPEELRTFGYHMLVQVLGRNASMSRYPYTTAYSVLMGLLSYPIVSATRWLLDKFDPNVEF